MTTKGGSLSLRLSQDFKTTSPPIPAGSPIVTTVGVVAAGQQFLVWALTA
jgi:hypothetical protein